jgi:hypothetical protein
MAAHSFRVLEPTEVPAAGGARAGMSADGGAMLGVPAYVHHHDPWDRWTDHRKSVPAPSATRPPTERIRDVVGACKGTWRR